MKKINITAIIVLVIFLVGCTGVQTESLQKTPEKNIEQKK